MGVEDATSEQLEGWFRKNELLKKRKRGQLGKDTEDLAKTILGKIRGVIAWNSNNGIPLCDKVVCWRGRFVLVECKETHAQKLPHSCLTDQENRALLQTELRGGLGLLMIRWIQPNFRARQWIVDYVSWKSAATEQRYKYFDLSAPPDSFRELNLSEFQVATDRNIASQFEKDIETLLKARPIL